MDVIILNHNLHHSNANGFSKFMREFRGIILLSGKCCSIFHYLKEFTDVTDSKWEEKCEFECAVRVGRHGCNYIKFTSVFILSCSSWRP